MPSPLPEQTERRFLSDFGALTTRQRADARRCMAEVRQDPLTLRPTWRALPFPFAPGTTDATVGDVAIRFVVKLDAAGDAEALVWLRARSRAEFVG